MIAKDKPKNKPGKPRKVPIEKEEQTGDNDIQPMDESGETGIKRTAEDMTEIGPSSSTDLPRRQPLRIVSSMSPRRFQQEQENIKNPEKKLKRINTKTSPDTFVVDDISIFSNVQDALINYHPFIFEVSERSMSINERSEMMGAKSRELQSFFDNNVWVYTDKVIPERTMKARFVLTWKQDDNGKDVAKARLVIQGYNDPDALAGKL